jgi:hypothetical protein
VGRHMPSDCSTGLPPQIAAMTVKVQARFVEAESPQSGS